MYRMPQSLQYYCFNRLDNHKRQIYTMVKNQIEAFQPEITFPRSKMSTDDVFQVIRYVLLDHPDLYWVNNVSCTQLEYTAFQFKVRITYCLTKAEVERRNRQIENAITPFVSSLTNNMSQYEMVKKVYENIIKLVDYDSIGLEQQERTGTRSDVPDDLRSIYGVFVQKKAVCTGYAKATQYLINLLGIGCVLVSGNTYRKGLHAWNLLKLDGDYYYLDTTWGDYSNTNPGKSNPGIGYDYFCITTDMLLLDHTPDNEIPLPNCTATKYNYFIYEGLYFTDYSKVKIAAAMRKQLLKNETTIRLKFANPGLYTVAKRALLEGTDLGDIFAELRKSGFSIQNSYNYSENDRMFVLTFMLRT